MIASYVEAYKTAELDARVARVELLSDAELLEIAGGRRVGGNAAPRENRQYVLMAGRRSLGETKRASRRP